jgi:hypothetical protein
MLPEMFGRKSTLQFFKLLEDHSASAEFLAAVAKYYRLELWHKNLPVKTQDWTDLCECWIGAFIMAQRSWDEEDPFTEITEWFQQILCIRYQVLSPYVTKHWVSPANDNIHADHDTISITSKEIVYPNHSPGFDGCILTGIDPSERFIGYLATAQDQLSQQSVDVFHTVKKKAEQLARRNLQTRLRDKTHVAPARPKYEKKLLPTSAGPIDLFTEYRAKCFNQITSSLSSSNALPKSLLNSSKQYEIWLRSIDATSANLKTRAMLSWNLVNCITALNLQKSYIKARNRHYDEAFMLLNEVLKFAVIQLPRTAMMTRYLSQVEDILVLGATKWGCQVEDDFMSGRVYEIAHLVLW